MFPNTSPFQHTATLILEVPIRCEVGDRRGNQETRPQGRLTKIVAIDGYGGSGKSELADRLARELGETTVVRTDDFARPNVVGWEWNRLRVQVLEPVMNDHPGRYQRYDWDSDRPAEWHDVPVGGTLIVEGVSSMRDELGRYWDYAIWLDCPHELRLHRH